MKEEYDVIVVGSGPGGASVAREMSLSGKKVLIIERGGYLKTVGNTPAAVLMANRLGFTRSKEKHWVVSVNNCGGASNAAAGCAIPPPKIVFDQVGINLDTEVAEARDEMWIGKLPDDLVGQANLRLVEAANDLGYSWDKIENFIDPEKCIPECSDCMLGCARGAKWTARVYVDEAVDKGADLMLHTRVERVLVENGQAMGVEAKKWGKSTQFFGKTVVLSAAMGNTPILRRSGVDEAGRSFACDFLQFVGGISKHMNTLKANPMTVGTLEHYESDGFVILPIFYTWATFAMHLMFMGPRYLPKFPNFRKYTGIMVKIKDDIQGEISTNGSFSKPVSRADRAKLDKGVDIMKRVLRKVGCPDESMFVSDPMGAHPSASCRIGDVVDTNLQTRIQGLYCCDSSVVPEALGLPVVWTAVALGKRLSKHLNNTLYSGSQNKSRMER